jgi:hypothetical protein
MKRGDDRWQGRLEIVFTWRHGDGEQRLCPSCGMKLWASPIPRPVRFYDLRHYPDRRIIPRGRRVRLRGRLGEAVDAG